METLRLTLLGHPTFSLNEAPLTNFRYSKAQALLCYLVVTGRPHARSALVGLLWGDLPEAKARTNLRRVLATLRRQIDPHTHHPPNCSPQSREPVLVGRGRI